MAEHRDNSLQQPKASHTHVAGAFDIRNFIGILIGIYGIVLLGCGLWGDVPEGSLKQASDNLWAGGIMLAAGILFIIWAVVRPVMISEDAEDKE